MHVWLGLMLGVLVFGIVRHWREGRWYRRIPEPKTGKLCWCGRRHECADEGVDGRTGL